MAGRRGAPLGGGALIPRPERAIPLRGYESPAQRLAFPPVLCYTWAAISGEGANALRRERHNGLAYYRFESLIPHPNVVHGVFTRMGGASAPPFDSLNLGGSVGDDPQAVAENYERLCATLGIRRGDVATAYQQHTDRVAVVGPDDRGRVIPATDGLITDAPGVFLTLRFGDCVPLLLYDPVQRAIGLAHAGWMGTVQLMARRVVEAMGAAFGSRPSDLLAGIGPAIGPCCYQIGEDVAKLVRQAGDDWPALLRVRPDGSMHLDLWEANRRQLAAAGVERIEVAGLCTACRHDEFFSHRAEGGQTGRFGVVIGIRDDRGIGK